MKEFCKKHYIAASLLLAAAVTIVGLVGFLLWDAASPVEAAQGLPELLFWFWLPVCVFYVYPIVLTAIELFLLLYGWRGGALRRPAKVFDGLTLGLGALYTPLYCALIRNIDFTADWEVQLQNAALHSPVWPGAAPTLAALLLAGLAGYLILTWLPLSKLPPLVIVAGIAGMYLACGVELLWCVQVMTRFDLWLVLLPLNVLVIAARTIRDKTEEWNSAEREEKAYSSPLLGRCNEVLCKSKFWPILAFVAVWPLLGVLIGVLALFGQSPNAAIRAFTETSDWALSQQVSPQNVYYDEHYLCTVAAGGHRKLVKPLRKGVRHGHEVTVNRQLCVANAFEQILEERTPRFHRLVRHIYDTYGFPIAKLIRSSWAADGIYLLMKPLEWLFLAALYAVDVHPEDRIAVQYTGKTVGDFQ